MLLRLLAITAALFLITFSNALSYDTSTSHHLARHQHIAARHPAVKRASVSTRCKKRNSTPAAAPSSTSHPNTPTAPPPSSSLPQLRGKKAQPNMFLFQIDKSK